MSKTSSRQDRMLSERRAALKRIAALGVLAGAPAWMVSRVAGAAENCNGQAPKAALQYQDTPHGKQRCDNCMHFCAGPKANAMGKCAIVKGAIAPQGWCTAWAAAKQG